MFDALESAFQLIDTEDQIEPHPSKMTEDKPVNVVHQHVEEHVSKTNVTSVEATAPEFSANSPVIQREPPVTKPIPLYENVELLYPNGNTSNNDVLGLSLGRPVSAMLPPKEKPPPPPVDDIGDDELNGDVSTV